MNAIQEYAATAYEANVAVRQILETAVASLRKVDLSGPSTADGYDLTDIPAMLRDMMPTISPARYAGLLDSARSLIPLDWAHGMRGSV